MRMHHGLPRPAHRVAAASTRSPHRTTASLALAADRAPRCPCAGTCPRCARSGPGQPLDAGVRRSLEASYHTDLSSVRVHTGPRAHELARAAGAHAVTSGHDIYFARGRYAPRDEAGWRRIAHEVAHVVQQRNGPARGGSGYVPAEVEAERGADSAWAGRGVTLSQPAAGLLQREDDDASPQTAPGYRLQLDPELELLMFQQYLRFWLGATLTGGEPSDAAAEEDRPAPSPDGPMPPAALLPPVYRLPLPSEFFRPIDPLLVQPDIGAVLAPYNLRNVPLAGRDIDAASAIFQRNYSFVSGLPDLRSMAPDIVRPLIPGHWRRSIAEAFTAATLDAQLRRDHPTPIEAADLSFYRMTGVSTIYVPLPAIPF